MAELGVDFYALTGHKLYAPTGIGALWAKLELLRAMPPFLGGGSMIRKVTREGTTYADVAGALRGGHAGDRPGDRHGLGAALARRDSGWRRSATTSGRSPTTPWSALAEVPGLRVFGPPRGPERLGPVSFEIDGIHAHDVSEILDRHGVAVRAGHHCAQVLMERLGVAATARASFGVYTTPEEIDRLVDGPRRRPPGLRPVKRFASLDDHGRALPRPDPRALQAAAQLRPSSTSPTSSSRTPTRSAATSST